MTVIRKVETLIKKAPLLEKWSLKKLLICISKPVAYCKAEQNRNKDIISLNFNCVTALLVTNLETDSFHKCRCNL